MSNAQFVAESRTETGKADMRRARHAGLVPAVVYGADKEEKNLYLKHNEVVKTLEDGSVYSQIVDLVCGSEKEKVVLKEVQTHPFKPQVMHIDMMRIKSKEKLTMHVPVHCLNEDTAVGVKKQGGVVSHLMSEVEIKCLPADLPSALELDLAEVELDQVLHLSDIVLPKGVEIVALSHGDDHNHPVVSIHKPKAVAIEEPTDEASDAEASEGESEAEE